MVEGIPTDLEHIILFDDVSDVLPNKYQIHLMRDVRQSNMERPNLFGLPTDPAYVIFT